ncbi:carboxypeptidase-like regulatory domain-containing protein [Polaribacter sp. HL-MS24]|uniref:carboxypeptidase-like regulatory domain-containing protein n=1 Tax=Polaribacter sp. HL-MS24 TaxID=3077735 RepID=UPI00293440BF|nr:carboxypeptidase-like regulatory domain-containing protein [Polaribacter sp. HL-MS24]WOC39523.1 carboxypeptidase-like regulatory domain-containing protein [Polaribacter sp. HL-MS24]
MEKIIRTALLLWAGISIGQIKLTGVVKDSIGNPLEMANIIALDTVAKRIASYGFSDKQGNYKLDLNSNTTYNIKISYVGFKDLSEFVKTTASNISKNYTLYEDNMLDGINIVSKMPVTIQGDTIIYNADSFTNGTERKLEDILKKLPWGRN